MKPAGDETHPSGEESSDKSLQATGDGVHQLLNDGKYSDFIVKCGDRDWRIHRAIVCSRSSYFKKMCEGQSKEVEQGFITFEGEDPAHIEEMLMFLYTMRYPQKPFRDGTASDMVLDAYMYAIADRYGLPKLQTEARRAFEARLPLHYTDPTFMEAVKVAYDSTPQTDRGLRDMIMGVVWGNRSVMLVKEHVQECVMGSEGLKHDLLMELFATPGVVGYKKKERAKKITV